MSIELILAIFFFGLLPLIERLIRAAREREGDHLPPELPEPPPMRERHPPLEHRPAPSPKRRARPRIDPAPEPAALRPRASEMPIARATAHDRRTADAFMRRRERVRRRDIADALHSGPGQRRAIVLMTVLGPCRALSPYDRA